MKETTSISILVLTTFFLLCTSDDSSSSESLNDSDEESVPPARRFVRQFLIDEMINSVPKEIQNEIDHVAHYFGMNRDKFLSKCIDELQAFKDYSKIDGIFALKSTMKFINENLTTNQKDEIQDYEETGMEIIAALFNGSLKRDYLRKFYDLQIKVVTKKIAPQLFVDQFLNLINSVEIES